MNIEYMEPDILKKRLRSLVRLDEAMTPPEKDWLRIWTSGISDDGVRWYMLDNGGGDSMIILFAQAGVLVKGFDHENALNQFASDGEWDDAFFEYVFRDMPRELAPLLTDDERNETTFCMWYQYDTGKWYQNEYPDNDGGKKYRKITTMKKAKKDSAWRRSNKFSTPDQIEWRTDRDQRFARQGILALRQF